MRPTALSRGARMKPARPAVTGLPSSPGRLHQARSPGWPTRRAAAIRTARRRDSRLERGHIGDRRQRHEIEQPEDRARSLPPGVRVTASASLNTTPAAASTLVRIRTIRLPRIEHRKTLGDVARWQMVIADDHIDAGRPTRAHGRVRRRPTVGRHHDRVRRPRRRPRPRPRTGRSHPEGDVARRVPPGRPAPNGPRQQRRRRHAVHVVVAVHEDRLTLLDRLQPDARRHRRARATVSGSCSWSIRAAGTAWRPPCPCTRGRGAAGQTEIGRCSASSERRDGRVVGAAWQNPAGWRTRPRRSGGIPVWSHPQVTAYMQHTARLADLDRAPGRHDVPTLQRHARIAVSARWSAQGKMAPS